MGRDSKNVGLKPSCSEEPNMFPCSWRSASVPVLLLRAWLDMLSCLSVRPASKSLRGSAVWDLESLVFAFCTTI